VQQLPVISYQGLEPNLSRLASVDPSVRPSVRPSRLPIGFMIPALTSCTDCWCTVVSQPYCFCCHIASILLIPINFQPRTYYVQDFEFHIPYSDSGDH
jgi:hypothetical protein